MANKRLSKEKQALVLAALCEGTPIEAVARMFKIGTNTITRVIRETGELIDELDAKHGVKFVESGHLTSPRQRTLPIQAFIRTGGASRRYAVTFGDRKEIVHPNLLRSLCAGLGLDPTDFGLTIEGREQVDTSA